jgi:hypothetical protein
VANTRHDPAGGNSAGPRRGSQPKTRARERIAAERAARKRAEARRRILVAVASVTAVLAVVVGLVAVKLTATPARLIASESPASSLVVRQVTTVPAAVLTRVNPGQEVTPLRAVKTSGPPLTIGGKPAIVFVSEESCPFCAAERWSLAVALSHFGSWSQLGTTTSSATDVYPDTATLLFRTARYQSTELTLRMTELTDNAGRALQAQTPRASNSRIRKLKPAASAGSGADVAPDGGTANRPPGFPARFAGSGPPSPGRGVPRPAERPG